MARRSVARDGAAWGCAAALALTACGGQSFVFDADAGMDSAAPPTSTADGAALDPNIACPGMVCAVGSTCCTGSSTNVNTSCPKAGGICAPCTTSLSCARDTNCPNLGQCCIGPAASTTTCSGDSEAFVSTCRSALAGCMPSEARLCNSSLPPSTTCPAKFTCSTAASDLQKWGLPPGTSDFGVCVAN
jgi:hypothetical protein